MTIFIEEYIAKGYCSWSDGNIIVWKSCPQDVREELESIDRLWMEQHGTKDHLVLFTSPAPEEAPAKRKD